MIRQYPMLSRGLALIMVLLAAAAIWLVVLAPLAAWRHAALERTETANRELAHLHRATEGLAAQRQQLSGDGITGLVWEAAQQGEATALIQAKIGTLASSSGLSVRAVTPGPVRDIPMAKAVAVRLECEASLDQLLAFLVALEFHSPLMVIEGASLRRLVRPNDTSVQPVLFVQLDIIAPISTQEDGL